MLPFGVSSLLVLVEKFAGIFLAAEHACNGPSATCTHFVPKSTVTNNPVSTIITYATTTERLAPTTTPCTHQPTDTIPNTIATNFAIQVQNGSGPAHEIDNHLINLWDTEGGDKNLYLSPAGSYAFNFQLKDGVVIWGPVHMVINGEWTPEDNTTKMFMTSRGDPKAIFDVVYGCSPPSTLQKELRLKARGDDMGGDLCVRPTTGNRYELRYSPPGNTPINSVDGTVCINVVLALVQGE